MRGFRAEMGGQFWHEGQAELHPGEAQRWQEAAYYDRGWCTLPSTQEAMDFVDELLDHFK